MTIEFWPKKPRKPKLVTAKKRRPRRPKLPVRVGKAQQMLSGAIILGDHEQAAWVYRAAMQNLVSGSPRDVQELRERLDRVMAP